MLTKNSSWPLLFSLLIGCASVPAAAPDESGLPTRVTTDGGATMEMSVADRPAAATVSVAAEPARAFAAARAAYEALGIDIGELNEVALVVGNPRAEARRTLAGRPAAEFLDCGITSTGQPIANTHRLRFSIRTTVTPREGGGSLVTSVVFNGSARTMSGVSTDPVLCVSRGALEQLIAERVRSAPTAP